MDKTTTTNWTHELVARQAAVSPDALAVSSAEQQLTFLELDGRANRLARHIHALGVTAETPVGLYFERSLDFVVAALAVLKAGGAYVPLDPAYPPGRIATILKDAGAPLLLSHKWMAASLPGGPWQVVDLDFDARRIAAQNAEPPAVRIAGHQLAYIVYTSGSSGNPKGVEVTHANLLHLVLWHQRAFTVASSDRASQIAGLAFDAAVWEIWCHLSAGASLHLIDEPSRRSPEQLRDWLIAQRITIAFVPTIFTESLITFEWPQKTALRTLLTGADTLHRFPHPGLPFTLINNYGPTECTVLVTSGVIDSGSTGQMPSIGRPIDDTEILILNSDLKPVFSGDEGEICVAGPQVARGYRNLPQLTAEKFVTDKATGRRLYRTGDRGRFLPDGQVAFLGRQDEQIKIRGFRVEPDEIVAHLNSHPGIRNSVVLARGDHSAEKSLVAYVVPVAGSAVTSAQLTEHLRSRLPEYMLPSAYVSIPSIPLTTTGKCDREALPAPTASAFAGAPVDGRQNSSEVRIKQLVSGLMNGKPITREDNFFLVGGHSLLAAQLVARMRDAFDVSLSLRQLFEAPTIAALAEVVDRKLAECNK